MRTVIKELLVFSIAIVWKQWNTELHGTTDDLETEQAVEHTKLMISHQ
jgi:hypothetical protein